MHNICIDANMSYVNITFECGAAIKGYKLIWNYPSVFDKFIIHLGNFHFMKEIFTSLWLKVLALKMKFPKPSINILMSKLCAKQGSRILPADPHCGSAAAIVVRQLFLI